MKRAALLVVITACRFNFDEHAGDAGSDTGADAEPARRCTATKVNGFAFGAPGITDLAAAQVPQGYSLGAVHVASTFWGVHLDRQLVPATPGPSWTTPVSPNNGMYENGSLYFDGVNLDGSLTVADGTAYMKTFPTDMTGFFVAVQRTGSAGEPSIARVNGTSLVSTWYHDNVIQFVVLLADGSPDTVDRSFTPGTANIRSVSVADGPSAIIAWSEANGTCGVGSLDAQFGVSLKTLGTACTTPYVHGNGTDVAAVYDWGAYIRTSTIQVQMDGSFVVGNERMIGQGTGPVVIAMGERWAAWRDNSRLHMSPLANIAEAVIENLPSGPPDAYTPAGPYLFAVWGAELWAITCP
ncbi:MAG TPA: hypothetical protein VMZ53_27145 [Kofleriaceae bacterium]|nr:hypothetical protein [Kofleriaceae bacterium]